MTSRKHGSYRYPRLHQPGALQQADWGERRPRTGSMPMRILIVDDHPIVASGCRAVLAGEPEIVRLVGAGKSLSEIAWLVQSSYKTVANTSSIMRQKLGIRSSVELVRLAIESGVA